MASLVDSRQYSLIHDELSSYDKELLYNIEHHGLPHDRCNFITSKIMLGARPVYDTLSKLENFDIDIFIDLREQTNYTTTKTKYHFPIKSGGAPSRVQAEKILNIVLTNSDKRIYIHCNGGNGRAGTIGAYLIGKLFGYDVQEAVQHIEMCRKQRIDKTKDFIPTPEMPTQINFLFNELGLKSGNVVPNRNNKAWIKKITALEFRRN